VELYGQARDKMEVALHHHSLMVSDTEELDLLDVKSEGRLEQKLVELGFCVMEKMELGRKKER
jgi:hypothetical protein